MKYKDYYQALGIERTASLADVKKAYRKLAHLYHPDVSKDPKGEEKFKEIAEAYATLKDSEKRQEYDNLGQRPSGENFTPPPEWQQQYGANASAFDDVDLADILNSFRSGGHSGRSGRPHGRGREQANFALPGEDYTVNVSVSLEKIYSGGETEIKVELPEYDEHGLPHRVAHTFRISIPKGATEGQRLRLSGKGGPGQHGGKPGNLYIVLAIEPHARYRLSGRDLYFDLPITSWEAALGTTVEIPTLGGNVELKIKPGVSSGQRLRLSGRGLPVANAATGTAGDLYAVLQIVVPKTMSQAEQALYEQLAAISEFKPRVHFNQGAK